MSTIDELNDYVEYFDLGFKVKDFLSAKKIADISMLGYIEKLCVKSVEESNDSFYYVARSLLTTILLKDYDLNITFNSNLYFALFPSEIANFKNPNVALLPKTKIEYKPSQKLREDWRKLLGTYEDKFSFKYVPNTIEQNTTICLIPFFHTFLFALDYVYQQIILKTDKDNKRFEKKKSDRILITNSRQKALKKILEYTLDLFKNELSHTGIIDKLYKIYVLTKINKEYCFFKINKMVQMMEIIKTEATFEKLHTCLNLKYKEIVGMEKIFDEEIFYNEDFIKFCLKSDFHDPFQILYLVIEITSNEFQANMNDPITHLYQKLNDFEECNNFGENFSFREYLISCRCRTKAIIDELSNKVNTLLISQSFDCELTFNNDEKSICVDIQEYYENLISNFTLRKDEVNIDEINSCYTWYDENSEVNCNYAHASLFWDEYYFGDLSRLREFVNSDTTDDYVSFLFDNVEHTLPKLFSDIQ